MHHGGRVIAQDVEICLHLAFVEARQARHRLITVEHLLLALLDNDSAAQLLRARACNIEDLRRSLQNFVSRNMPRLPTSSEVDTQPTLSFQRVIQRAIMHVRSTARDKDKVTGADMLAAIFEEKDSYAVYYLHRHGVTGLDVGQPQFNEETSWAAAKAEGAEAVVQAQVDAFNARDIRAFMETYARDAMICEYPAKLLMKGTDQIQEFYANKRFNDARFCATIVNRIVMDHIVIDHEQMSISFPEGPGGFEAIAVYEVRNGKIQKVTLIRGQQVPDAD
jgi:hypothetical protein